MTTHQQVLLIFVKNPEAGKVKTRLAKTVGPENALTIYKHLLQHTHDVTEPLAAEKIVYYSRNVEEFDLFESHHFEKARQSGGDLGERMLNAFTNAFRAGYHRAVIIGSDCYELTTEILEQAYQALDESNVVVGPAKDGGYYLLGMQNLYPELFQNKKWSTEDVILDTLLDLKNLDLTYTMLPPLSDVDHEEDLGSLASLLQKS